VVVAGDQVLVNDGHPAGCGRAGVPGVAMDSGVDVEHWRGPSARGTAGQHVDAGDDLRGHGEGVPNRADLHADEVIELVPPVRGGSQSKPPPCADLPDRVLERRGRDVVALVRDDQPVPGGEVGDVVTAGQGLQCQPPSQAIYLSMRGIGTSR